MPTGGNKRKQAAAQMKNHKALNDVLDGSTGVIGRVEKALGNSSFQVLLPNGSMTQGLIRGCLKGGKNSATYITAGAFVILAETEKEGGSRMKQHEILGVINDPKTFKLLKKSGRLPDTLVADTAADELFDHGDDDEVTLLSSKTAGASHSEAKTGALRSALTDELQAMSDPVYDEFASSPTVKKARVAPGAPMKAPRAQVSSETKPEWQSAWKDDVAPTPKPVERGAAPDCWEDEVDVDAL